MGNLTRHTKNELRRLPLMLGKLLGGIMAVLGFTMAVFIFTRKPYISSGNALLLLLLSFAGIAVFLLSDRRLAVHSNASKEAPVEKKRINILSWALLVILAGIFMIWVYFITG